MEHPGPWSAYGQHYPRLGAAGTNPLSQTGQLNELNLPRQDPMASYAAPGASALLLPTHHTLNAASQGVPHTDPSFVNTANHLLTPSYHDTMLGSFPATTKSHHPLTPLNMAPHSGAIFKNLGKETEINELRGGFSRRSGSLPVTNATSAVSAIGALANSGLFNSQSSPHSWRPPDIMPTPSSPFGVLPHETVMHRSNANTPTSSTPKPHQNQPQTNKPPRSEPNARYMEEHAGYRNVMVHQGAMLDNNSRSPALMMAAVQPEVVSPLGSLKATPEYGVGVYHGTPRGALLPQNYLSHAQFPPLEVHGDKRDLFSSPHQHQSPCAGPASTQTLKQATEIFAQQQTIPQGAPNASQGSPAPSINQSAILQRSPQLTPNVSAASPSHPRDLSNYVAFPTTPTIPAHSQSFLANQMPTGMEFNGGEQSQTTPHLQPQTQGAPTLTCQNQYPSSSSSSSSSSAPQINSGAARVTGLGPMYPMSVPPPTTYDPMMANLDKNNKMLTPPLTQCMINNNNSNNNNNNNNNNGIAIDEPGSVYGAQQVPMSAVPTNNLELSVPLQEMEEDGKEDSKRKRKRRRSRRDSNEPRITPMTPVQANKLSHKMAPPLSVPLHHPPVTSPLTPMDLSAVETSDAFHHLSQNVHGESNPTTNDGASTSAPSSLSPSDGVNLSPPQLPSTPASVSNPGSVPDKRNSLLNMSIEDDLGFLAELPPACNIRHQKRMVVQSSWPQRQNNGSFQDVFMKFVKGNATMMGFVEQKKSTRGRGRGAACAATSSRRLTGSESADSNASSGFFPLSANCKLENVKFESLKPSAFGKKEASGVVNSSDAMVPNPEAPKFSSDDDFSPMGLESLVHSAIQGLSDGEGDSTVAREQSQQAQQTAEATNGHLRGDESEKQNPIKIKLVGLHSGNVQTAKRGRGRRRKSQVKMEVVDDCDGKEKMDNAAPGTPVRRASMRKCKEVVMQRRHEAYVSSESDKDGNDSDCDPAWTPLDKEPKVRAMSSDDEKKKKYIPKKPLPIMPMMPKRRGRPPKLRMEDGNTMPMTPSVAEDDGQGLDEQDGVGKIGDFVVAVADMVKEHPPIWRVDGKALLQKFEAFEQDGRVLYRNKSTYAGWTCNSRAQYQIVPVRLVHSKKCTVVVEWERADCSGAVDNNALEALEAQETEAEFIPQKESFEVYLQTLISQVLDPNFISEIIKEQDEYFLSHVNVVDTMVERCKQQVLDTVSWLPQFRETIERSPRLTVSGFSEQSEACHVCQRQEMVKKAVFTRLDYDDVTLAYTQPIPGEGVTQFKLCSRCADMVWLYNQVHHQKFNFYHQCTAKVLEMRVADPSKESHIILQYCLLDGTWINKLLKEVQSTWQRCLRLKR